MFRPLASSAAALIIAAAPALANVTPAQVWENLTQYYSELGYDVSVAARDEAGSNLTLNEVVISSAGGEGQFSLTMPQVLLNQTGDARVRTEIKGPVRLSAVSTLPDGLQNGIEVKLTAPGNEMISSGTPDDIVHDITYPSLTADALVIADGQTPSRYPLTIAATDITAQYRNSGQANEVSYQARATGLDVMSHVIAREEGSTSSSLTIHVDGVESSGRMQKPSGETRLTERPDLALNAGLSAESQMLFGKATGSVTFTNRDEMGAVEEGGMDFTSESNDLKVSASKEGITYQIDSRQTEYLMSIPEMPFPLGYGVAESSALLTLPVSQSEQPQTFHLAAMMGGVTLDETIWNLFDPQALLPRDPASLTIDLQGDAILHRDLLDPTLAQSNVSPQEVFTPGELRISQIALELLGANADVTGSLTMPGGASQPPVGTITGRFSGINGLLENLGKLGVLPQDQLMASRMMLAMFTRPVEGNPDQLTSDVEIREGGSIFVNGQQMR